MLGLREGSSAILIDDHGRFLFQQRDCLPHIRDPGKISLFGGAREKGESFLDCITREIEEEIGYYIPPQKFLQLGYWSGPDYAFSGGTLRGCIYLAEGISADGLAIREGRLTLVNPEHLSDIGHDLSLSTQYALTLLHLSGYWARRVSE